LILLLLLTASCSKPGKYLATLEGEWRMGEFYHKGKDLGATAHYNIKFEKDKVLFLRVEREMKNNKFRSATYTLYETSDTLRMTIQGHKEKWLDGTYDVHIDTIQETPLCYFEEIILDTEETYIRAIRGRNKGNSPRDPALYK